MQFTNQSIIFSPSDLTTFVKSPFASWMDRLKAEFPSETPSIDTEDPFMTFLAKRGLNHESNFLAKLSSNNQVVKKIPEKLDGKKLSDKERLNLTRKAMADGVDVIFQACLMANGFRGYADFLVKVPGKSNLGSYHYEVWDTKLANSVKPGFVLQLCCYAQMLEELQGKLPEKIAVAMGNNEVEKLRISDYFDYFEIVLAEFLAFQKNFNKDKRPNPADSKEFGRWSEFAEKLLIEQDDLSQVAGITKRQIKQLELEGITTCQELAKSKLHSLKGLSDSVFTKLQAQADIFKRSNGQCPPLYEIKPHKNDEKIGLALLPPRSKLDVFFDIEGNPLHPGGLEYLWGNTYLDDQGNKKFKDFWAHDAKQEKAAFASFIKWVYQRWQQDPEMHIYHYAPYEVTACKKMMTEHGVCEYELDQLLRNHVFVDLYKVVTGAMLLGEPRYSIKNVELLYRPEGRQTKVKNGAASIVSYYQWRDEFDKGKCGDSCETSDILNEIRLYNIDDCNYTYELAELLWKEQQKHQIQYLGKTDFEEPNLTEEITKRTELHERLMTSADLEKNTNTKQLIKNLAYMVDFHKREKKPVLWRLFERLGMDPDKLIDDIDCLAGCYRSEKEAYKPSPRAKHLAYEYHFDVNQEFKAAGESYYIVGEEDAKGKPLKVSLIKEDSDISNGLIVLKSGKELPDEVVLVPGDYISNKIISDALYEVILQFEKNSLENTAIIDFLTKSSPQICGRDDNSSPIVDTNDPVELLNKTILAVSRLNNSYLAIQGPPGTGKTYTGSHIIADLLKQGKRIGISSNSHKAINNLLIETALLCKTEGINANFCCAKNTDNVIEELGISVIKNDDIVDYLSGPAVIGTTAWGFCREDVIDNFDYLFIDEAGQVSVANLVAMSRCSKNIVLLGDQMQLGQPSQAKHPEESGLSILDYLLADNPIIPANMGVFLANTYRMHSKVNEYISDAIYKGKLESVSSTDNQSIALPTSTNTVIDIEAGIKFVSVTHKGNTQASDEEIAEIVKLVDELTGRIYADHKGHKRNIGLEDMLFVAPYNHQVNKLKMALGENARVGSVDKFQGQQAPIVFFSLCTSDATESARGVNFLFDKHRINVAISRAQCLAVVVGNPLLFKTPANSTKQMAKINVVAKLKKYMKPEKDICMNSLKNVSQENDTENVLINEKAREIQGYCTNTTIRNMAQKVIERINENPLYKAYSTNTPDIRIGFVPNGKNAERVLARFLYQREDVIFEISNSFWKNASLVTHFQISTWLDDNVLSEIRPFMEIKEEATETSLRFYVRLNLSHVENIDLLDPTINALKNFQ